MFTLCRLQLGLCAAAYASLGVTAFLPIGPKAAAGYAVALAFAGAAWAVDAVRTRKNLTPRSRRGRAR